MRPSWTGSITFGLVNIPVRAHRFREERPIERELLHKSDMGRIRYAYVCESDSHEIPRREIVKGYRYGQDDYVVLTKEELKAAAAKRSDALAIEAFVKPDEIDPVFYERPYVLEPGKGAEHAYGLLRTALERSGRFAVATYALRGRDHVGVIMPYGDGLALNQLRFQSQLQPASGLRAGSTKLKEPEIKAALTLVEALSAPFTPTAYRDASRVELERLIERKARGDRITAPRPKPLRATRLGELVQALQKSLVAREPRRARPARAAASRRRKRAPLKKAASAGRARSRRSSRESLV